MARAKQKGSGRASGKSASGKTDAISLLKADHRQVEDLFEQFSKARDDDRRQRLATQICNALKVHTTIEEEIFYPAFLDATDDTDTHHEAEVEHEGAKKLIAEIEAASPDDDYFKAKVTVLSEMIKHHVREEEKGMFPEAKGAKLDLEELGERLAARKEELEDQQNGDAEDAMPPPAARKERGQAGRMLKGTR